MATLLSLPLELRSQIYLDTLSPRPDEPFTEAHMLNGSPVTSSWNLSFPPALLLTNKQIHAEAKHDVYGKNAWVMRASTQRTHNSLPPAAAIPLVRRAILKIYMDPESPLPDSRNVIVDSICRMLCQMPALQTLRIECAENGFVPPYPIEQAPYYPFYSYSAIATFMERRPEFRGCMNEYVWGLEASERTLVSKLLEPLLTLPGTCSLQIGEIRIERRDLLKARILEGAFARGLHAVIALRSRPH